MNQEFSWGAWWGGLALAIAVGAVLNVVAGVFAIAMSAAVLSALVGAAPGLILAGTSRLVRPKHFAQGVLTGALVIALIGGICGASLNGARFAG